MKLTLELEDCRFLSTAGEHGNQRWLTVDFHGKRFFVQRNVIWERMNDRAYVEQIDHVLIQEMELMLEGIFLNALEEVPTGVVIPMRCKTGEIWRNHFLGRCQCQLLKSIEKVNSQPDNSGGKR